MTCCYFAKRLLSFLVYLHIQRICPLYVSMIIALECEGIEEAVTDIVVIICVMRYAIFSICYNVFIVL